MSFWLMISGARCGKVWRARFTIQSTTRRQVVTRLLMVNRRWVKDEASRHASAAAFKGGWCCCRRVWMRLHPHPPQEANRRREPSRGFRRLRGFLVGGATRTPRLVSSLPGLPPPFGRVPGGDQFTRWRCARAHRRSTMQDSTF